MKKKVTLLLLIGISLLLLSSCDEIKSSNETGGIIVSEPQKADERMEQIISALKTSNKEVLKELFSEKAIDESVDFDGEIDTLFDFIEGNIESWERDGWASDESIEHGEKSLMIRFAINVKTDEEEYRLFVMDYNTDTINPDNEGIYMLEVSKASYSGEWESWQDRMRAGISIVE